MSPSQPEYALGRSAREYARLALQAELLRPISRRAFADAGIEAGMRVLDLGSGAGDVCLLLGEMVGPSGEVIGLDVDGDAVEHAGRRAAEAGMSHVRFQCGDFAGYEPETKFDAITGRLVLCYQADPVAALASVLPHLRPGGVVAFQESWMLPTPGTDSVTKRTGNCIVETFQRSGVHLDLGPRLHRVFVEAGLPQPQMRMEMLLDGREDSPLYRYLAETLRSLLPKAEEYGIARAADFDLETLAERLSAERRATGLAMMSLPMVSAWCRKAA
jgi:ubiquinone/menaquinone biosynthesis C-methylase UbiE